ncbi:MAG: ATP-grasp domain-containing protein, partial [Pseudomonadota bacterium]
TNDMIVQRRIRGREVSVLSLARDGEVLMSTTYEGLVHSGTVAVAFRRVTDCPAVDMWVKTFVARTGYSGFIAFDVMIDEAGTPFVIECNPRLTSGLHFFDHAGLAAAFLDGRPPRLAHKPQLTLQEGHTALAIAYTHILRPQEFFRRVKDVFTTRHVLWAWRDPLPFCLMTTASWPMVRKVLFGGMTLAEAATADIEWTGKVTSPASSERR